MKKLFTILGVAFGAYLGWQLGIGVNRAIVDLGGADVTRGPAVTLAFALGAWWGYAFRRAAITVSRIRARSAEPVAVPTPSVRVTTGRTPPTPRPAFQV